MFRFSFILQIVHFYILFSPWRSVVLVCFNKGCDKGWWQDGFLQNLQISQAQQVHRFVSLLPAQVVSCRIICQIIVMFQLHKDMVTGLLNHFPYEGLYPHNPVHAQRRFSGHQSDLELPQVWKTGSDATEAVDMFAVYFFYVIFLERGGRTR